MVMTGLACSGKTIPVEQKEGGSAMLISPPRPLRMSGTCQICFRESKDLQLTLFWDYEGYTCGECMETLRKENIAKMTHAMEQSEPAE